MPRKKSTISEKKPTKAVAKKEKEKKQAEIASENAVVKMDIGAAEELKEEKLEKEEKENDKKTKVYYEGVGSRKTATARVRLYTKNKDIIINGKDYKVYFPLKKWQATVEAPFEKMKCNGKFGLTAHVVGGGLSAQAEAVRLGISRALVSFNPDFKKRLRRAGYLTRDARMVERKKYGLKKARRAPQWSKR